MPTRRQLIQKITLNASVGTVTFSNIPQNYTDLQLVVSARSDASDYGSWATLNPNGDTANVTGRVLYNGTSAGLSASYASGNTGYTWINAALQTANIFSNTSVYIPNYSSTSAQKSWSVNTISETNNAGQNLIAQASFLWNSTAAITSITLDPQSTSNFLANSTFYLYGIAAAPIINGGEVTIKDGFKYHTFRSTSTLQVVEPGDVEYLVVAGGGGGGATIGGGGGAGGMLTGKTRISTGVTTITIGAGGTAAVDGVKGGSGGNTSIGALLTASGGGGGGSWSTDGIGVAGGSGGGGGLGAAAGGAGTSGQGNAGGTGYNPGNGQDRGGGGGGKGAVGTTATSGIGGNGGSGASWSNGDYYAGGGGGGSNASVAGTSSLGGGGSGGVAGAFGTAGSPNTGGGGGGGGGAGAHAGSTGGSGIVIIRYPYTGN